MENNGRSRAPLREFAARLLRVVIILPVSAVAAILLTAGIFRLWPRSHCADSDVFRGLALVTIVFFGLVVGLARIPVPRDRVPLDSILPSIVLLGVMWFPWCTHWPPLSRGYARGAIRDMRSIANAMDAHRNVAGQYPQVTSVSQLNRILQSSLQERDPWGSEFSLQSDGAHYTLISYGDCGELDTTAQLRDTQGNTVNGSADIVLRDGTFVQVPGGIPVNK